LFYSEGVAMGHGQALDSEGEEEKQNLNAIKRNRFAIILNCKFEPI